MNRYSWLEGYLLSMPGAVTDYKLEWQWQRYLVGGRMFAAVCTPGPEHAAHAGRTMVILKCDPRLAEAFREQYPEVVPGFYSDKRNLELGLFGRGSPGRRAAGLLRHVL